MSSDTNVSGGRPLPPTPVLPTHSQQTPDLTSKKVSIGKSSAPPTISLPNKLVDSNISLLAKGTFEVKKSPTIIKPVRASLLLNQTGADKATTTSTTTGPVLLGQNFKNLPPLPSLPLSSLPLSSLPNLPALPNQSLSKELKTAQEGIDKERQHLLEIAAKRTKIESTIRPDQITPEQKKELGKLENEEKLAKYDAAKHGINLLKEMIKTNPQSEAKLSEQLNKTEANCKLLRKEYLDSSLHILKEEVHSLKENLQSNPKKDNPNDANVKNSTIIIARYEQLEKLYLHTNAVSKKLERTTILDARLNHLQNELAELKPQVRYLNAMNKPLPNPTNSAADTSAKVPPSTLATPSTSTKPLPAIPLNAKARIINETAPHIISQVKTQATNAESNAANHVANDSSVNATKQVEASSLQPVEIQVNYASREVLSSEKVHMGKLNAIQNMKDLLFNSSEDNSSLKLTLKDTEFSKAMKENQKAEFTEIITEVAENLKTLQAYTQQNIDKFQQFEGKNDPLALASAIAKDLDVPIEVVRASARIANSYQDYEAFFSKNPGVVPYFKKETGIDDLTTTLAAGFQRIPRYPMLMSAVETTVKNAANQGIEGYSETLGDISAKTNKLITHANNFDELKGFSNTAKSTTALVKTIEKAQKNGGALKGTEDLKTKKNSALQPRGWIKVKSSDGNTLASARNGLTAGIESQKKHIEILDTQIAVLKEKITSSDNEVTKKQDIEILANLNADKTNCNSFIKEFEASMTTLNNSPWAKKIRRKSLEIETETTINYMEKALNVQRPNLHIEADLLPLSEERQEVIQESFREHGTKFTALETSIKETKTKLSEAKINLLNAQKEETAAQKKGEIPTQQLLDSRNAYQAEISTHTKALENHVIQFKLLEKDYNAFVKSAASETKGTTFEDGFGELKAETTKSLENAGSKLDNFKALWSDLMNPKNSSDDLQNTFVNVYRNVINKMELDGQKIPGDTRSEQLFNLFGHQFKTATENEQRHILTMTGNWLQFETNHSGDIQNPKVREALTSLLDQIDSSSIFAGVKSRFEANIKEILTTAPPIALKEGTQSSQVLLASIASGALKPKSKDYDKAVQSLAQDITARDFHYMYKIGASELALGSKVTPNLDKLAENGTDLAHLAVYAITQQEKPEHSVNVLNFFIDVQKNLMDGTGNSPPNLTGASSLHTAFANALVERVINSNKSKGAQAQLEKSKHVFLVGGNNPNENLKNYVKENPGTLLPIALLMGEKAKMEGVFDTKEFDLDRNIIATLPNSLSILEVSKRKTTNVQTYDIGILANQITKKYEKTKTDEIGSRSEVVDGIVKEIPVMRTQIVFDEAKFHTENRALANKNFPQKG